MAKAKGGGGKLNKSETVQVRFDPILKMAAELAAAGERRTLSNFTEIAVEKSVKQSVVAMDKDGNAVDAFHVANECWNSDPCIRLSTLVKYYPDLLTIRERKITECFGLINGFIEDMGDSAKKWKQFMISMSWNTFCQYADDQIYLEDVMVRLSDLRDKIDKGMYGKRENIITANLDDIKNRS